MSKKPQPTFEIPESFMTQLDEFTKGFLLITVNQEGEFKSYADFDNGVTKMGLIGYAKLKLKDMKEEFQFDYAMGGIDDDGFCEMYDEDAEDRFENGGGDSPKN